MKAGTGGLWPNREVPYVLDATISTEERVIIAAVSLPQQKLTVCFIIFVLSVNKKNIIAMVTIVQVHNS